MSVSALLFRRVSQLSVVAAVILACALLTSRMAYGQTSIADVSESPLLRRWSPLRPIGDLGLLAPQLPELPRLLLFPIAKRGVSGISSNPAQLPDEIDSAWTQLVVNTNGVSGSYRRPLDAGSVSSTGTSLAGWRRIGTRIAALGRVAAERSSLRDGSASAFLTPYGSSPFVSTDTNRPSLTQTVVTLEGAEGIALGAWRLGIAAGYRAHENSSTHSSASQIGRASTSGLSVGAAHEIGSNVRLGFYARGLQNSETVILQANPQTVRVYNLDGYVNVDPSNVVAALPPFLRRADRSATVWGTDAAGSSFGTAWTVYVEHQSSQERQIFSVLALNPPTDRWQTSGYAAGGVAQRTIRGVLATIRADWTMQRGDADRAETTTGAYRADASRLTMEAEVRYAPTESGWAFASILSLRRDQQTATDDAARLTTNLAAWMPAASAEVARRVSERLTFSLAYGRLQFTPNASVPSPANHGTSYSLFVAPAIEVAAASAHADQGSVTARWRTSVGAISVRLWASATNATTPPMALVPLPTGSRSTWGLAMNLEPRR